MNGITGRLDYLVDLGVDAIWLSPVYPSPNIDFGYDVSDYCAIDPCYGTLSDFDRLLDAAHARGIRVILDLVLNHTSDQHPWFVESRSSRDNPKRDWYLWADPAPGGSARSGRARSERAPNNWQSVFGGSGWEFDPATRQSYFHMFYKQQPDVNWQNPAVRQAMLDVFRFWLDRGVDGFRLDVFNAYFKHPRLASNPPSLGLPLYGFSTQRHVNDCDRPEMISLLQEIRALLDRYSTPGRERYMVGESFLSDAAKAAQYCGPDRLHAAFNFELLDSPWSARRWMSAIQRWEHLLGVETWPNYVLNNHDVIRSATRFHALPSSPRVRGIPFGKTEDDARLKVAAALLLTLRGTPFLYYGEEIGMRDIPIRSREEVLDPIGRRFWPFYKGRDGCRSPMQWSPAPNAGFTTNGAKPWLPIHPNASRRSVEAQLADPHSLLNFYRRLIAVRRASPALSGGMFQPVTFGTRFILAYLRQTQDQTVLVALNFSPRRQRLVLGSHLSRAELHLLLSTHRETLPSAARGALLALEPYEALVIEIK